MTTKSSTGYQESRGKLFGAGYEIYIVAFFVGLYFDKRREMNHDPNKRKGFGHQIQYWGNQESRRGRKSYGKIREYMFVALVAKSNIDFVELDKGNISKSKVVDTLIQTMEEYANYGLSIIADKLGRNPNYFYDNTSFLNIFLSLTTNDDAQDNDPESLD